MDSSFQFFQTKAVRGNVRAAATHGSGRSRHPYQAYYRPLILQFFSNPWNNFVPRVTHLVWSKTETFMNPHSEALSAPLPLSGTSALLEELEANLASLPELLAQLQPAFE